MFSLDFGIAFEIIVRCGLILQFEGGIEVPTTYAFALVEHRQTDKIRLRMQLSGEIKGVNTDEAVACARLSTMRSLVGELQKTWSIMKVFFLYMYIYIYPSLKIL